MGQRIRVADSGDFIAGNIVYYWRDLGKPIASKLVQRFTGWQGPCVVLARKGTSRVFLGTWGSMITVTPEQLRHATDDEIAAFENLDDMFSRVTASSATWTRLGRHRRRCLALDSKFWTHPRLPLDMMFQLMMCKFLLLGRRWRQLRRDSRRRPR